MAGTRFVFLDRDGTLVREVGYGHRLEDYELLAGVPAALARLGEAGFHLAIVTNQSGIGRGIFGWEDFERFHGRLLADLRAAGISIERTYICPHRPDDGCACRKPRPGLLHRARDELGASLAESWVVGDHAKDVELAANAGCRSVLVLTGHGAREREEPGAATAAAVEPDLAAAVERILAAAAQEGG